MKRLFLIILACFSLSTANATEELMFFHFKNRITLGAPVSSTDSVHFSADGSLLHFTFAGAVYSYLLAEIDSITFGPASQTVLIHFEDESTYLVNPLAFEGVDVEIAGAFVTVNASIETQDVSFSLSGNTSNGTFKIYSSKRYNLILNGVSITNPTGPAINVQSKKKTTVVLADGTINTLSDGLIYADPPNNEDQKAAFFSEAKLVFNGSGSLIINGQGENKHGLSGDDEIEIHGGIISIASALKDGIHANDGFLLTEGTIEVFSLGDGIDADAGCIEISGGSITMQLDANDVKGLSCDSTLLVSGGTIHLTMNGDQSKAIQSDQNMTFSGGNISIQTSGDAVLEASGSGFDPSYCTAIKSKSVIYLDGADITISSTGKAGRGISSDTDIIMSAGTVDITTSGNGVVYTNSLGQPDAYTANCLNADQDIHLLAGNLTVSSSGVAGKGIKIDRDLIIGSNATAPEIQITTSGTRLLISGFGSNANYAEAKAIKADQDVQINSGMISIGSSDDGIKAGNSITINNGVLDISNSVEGIEAPYITFNGGNTHVKASDDGINATFGNDSNQNDGSLLAFNGGYVMVNATGGDGLDSNGNLLMTGGTVVVHGPQSQPEVGMDVNGTINVNGGLLIVSGTNSFMTQAPNSGSDLYSLKIMTNQQLTANTLFHIEDATGNDILTFQPLRNYYSIIYASSAIQNGLTYSIYTGGSSSGTVVDGLYSGGSYSGGTHRKTFTVNSKVTNVNF